MSRLLVIALALASLVFVVDAGAQQSKPSGSVVKISVKDATLAVSGAGEDSLGTGKPYVD